MQRNRKIISEEKKWLNFSVINDAIRLIKNTRIRILMKLESQCDIFAWNANVKSCTGQYDAFFFLL